MKTALRIASALAVLALVSPAFAEDAKPAEPAKVETKAAPHKAAAKSHKKAAAKKAEAKKAEKTEAAKPAEAK